MYKDIWGFFFFVKFCLIIGHWIFIFYLSVGYDQDDRQYLKNTKKYSWNLAKARPGRTVDWCVCFSPISQMPFFLSFPSYISQTFFLRQEGLQFQWSGPLKICQFWHHYLLKSLLWLWSSSHEGPHPTNLDIHWVISHQFDINPGPSDKCSWYCRHVILIGKLPTIPFQWLETSSRFFFNFLIFSIVIDKTCRWMVQIFIKF